MSKKILYILLLIILSNILFAAKPGKFGLGIILGDPTGLNCKIWQSDRIACDAALAWSFGKEGSVHIHADYLIHSYEIIRVRKGKFPFYAGLGGRIESKDKTALGLRIPLGMNYLFENVPIDIFLEFVPTLNIIPSTEFDLEGGIGARYYF